MSQDRLIINNQIFRHIKTRLHSLVSIYWNSDFFVRVGPEELIKRELELHKLLIEIDFPVAKIIEEGWLNEWYYYTEDTLGDELLWERFCKNFRDNFEISPQNFEYFINVVERYAESQISSLNKQFNIADFPSGIQVEELFKEAPEFKEMIEDAITKVTTRLSIFPSVFSQGDFNPHNLFPKGVIDFDMGFKAPFWYDLITAIYHTYAFPQEWIAEYSRWYVFSEDQECRYFEMIDNIAIREWLPKISDFTQDFLIGRLIWSVVRLYDYPLLQKWRYNKFGILIEKYLNDSDFMDIYKS